MLKTFRDAWHIPELRKRILFTLMILAIYRLGCVIPVPFINNSALTSMFTQGDMLVFLNTMSGGALASCAIFALGVIPYIQASIIMQLLTVALPPLERIAREPDGQKKIQRYTRIAGGVVGLIMSIGYYFVVRNMGALKYTAGFEGFFVAVVIVLAFTAGAQLITWCGEQIDAEGIGNGISMLIFASIVTGWSGAYETVMGLWTKAISGEAQYYIYLPIIAVLTFVIVVFVIVLTNAERRIGVQYAKRVVGRKMMGGQSSYIPLKINMSGVMPVIFASSLVSIPGIIGSFLQLDPINDPIATAIFGAFNYNSFAYIIIYTILILAFNYFYVAIQYNPVEISNNIRQNNGTIPGIRPGKPTSDFISKTLNKITLIGGIFLTVVAISPILLGNITGVPIQLGGTSLLIMVGVALDTARSMDSFMTMRSHGGFL